VVAYALEGLNPALAGFDVYATYAYVDATIREDGPNKGNRVPFSSKHKGTLGVGYTEGPWQLNVDSSFQSNQYADNNKGKYVGEPRTVYVQTSIAF
jgi:Fe(3+) dicitrate transport protein